jgi:hypothetical protein
VVNDYSRPSPSGACTTMCGYGKQESLILRGREEKIFKPQERHI